MSTMSTDHFMKFNRVLHDYRYTNKNARGWGAFSYSIDTVELESENTRPIHRILKSDLDQSRFENLDFSAPLERIDEYLDDL